MAIDSDKFNVLYGKILAVIKDPIKSKSLAKILYNISSDLGLSTDNVVKYVTKSGLRFDNNIYKELNALRTTSSQIGFIDSSSIPPKTINQIKL